MASSITHQAWQPFQFITNPSAVIQAATETYSGTRLTRLRIATRVSIFYITNLVLYAVPLTLAGFGAIEGSVPVPGLFATVVGPFVSDVNNVWRFALALGQNSAYLFIASFVVFATFHVGVILTRSSQGLLQSLHTVVYSTGVYLAGIFTLTWFVSTAGRVVVADEILLNIQKRFVYFFIDLSGRDLTLPGGRPESVPTTEFTFLGQLVVAGLILLSLYFLYSLYLGARINHRASRIDSVLTIVFVGFSPALYVTGSILAVTITG